MAPKRPKKLSKNNRMTRHLKALGEAAASRSIDAFKAALEGVRNDDDLSPIQRGAILKVIAQEQASVFSQVIMKQPFGQDDQNVPGKTD